MPFSSDIAGHFSEGFPFHIGAQDASHLHHYIGPACELLIVRLRTIYLCGLPTLSTVGSLWSSLLELTLDRPRVVSFSSAFDLSPWTLSVFWREFLEVLGFHGGSVFKLLLLPLSRFSRVRLCATPKTAAHQAPPPLGFSRQEHWSGLPFPSPMHESEK